MPSMFMPTETNLEETRVVVPPQSVRHLVKQGFTVPIEEGAGEEVFFADQDFRWPGANTGKVDNSCILGGLVLGSGICALATLWVKTTAIPKVVALFNGMRDGASPRIMLRRERERWQKRRANAERQRTEDHEVSGPTFQMDRPQADGRKRSMAPHHD